MRQKKTNECRQQKQNGKQNSAETWKWAQKTNAAFLNGIQQFVFQFFIETKSMYSITLEWCIVQYERKLETKIFCLLVF